MHYMILKPRVGPSMPASSADQWQGGEPHETENGQRPEKPSFWMDSLGMLSILSGVRSMNFYTPGPGAGPGQSQNSCKGL